MTTHSAASDPIELFQAALLNAERVGIELHNAASLATMSADRGPSVRMILLKHADVDGFVFYTNLESRKAHELAETPRAALCFWWSQLQEQIRIEGRTELVDPEEADTYFATRDRGSQIGAWASRQSQPMASLEQLRAEVADVEERFDNKPVPRPGNWSGYRLRPERIEFWYGRPHRLHERYLYTRTPTGWNLSILYP